MPQPLGKSVGGSNRPADNLPREVAHYEGSSLCTNLDHGTDCSLTQKSSPRIAEYYGYISVSHVILSIPVRYVA